MKRWEAIINKVLQEKEITVAEIQHLLDLKDARAREEVFAAARKMRERYFGPKIFAYGFVYFSTHCRNNCKFCYYRNNNEVSPRYRKEPEEIMQISQALTKSGVHLLDLTMGEDPYFYQGKKWGELLDLVQKIKNRTQLPLMASFGQWPLDKLTDLKEAGIDWYACYQETHDKDLFNELRLEQDFSARMALKKEAKKIGLLIEDGILLGIGEDNFSRAKSIKTMAQLDVDQGRVMSFVPQEGTPMAALKTPERSQELLVIALLRLVLKDSLIPASLDVDGIEGLKSRLTAGANVVTSLIPPAAGLKGVSNSKLDIDEGKRTIAGVKEVLQDTELKLAPVTEYQDWIDRRRRKKERELIC